jgi:hypothetical protein
MATVIADMSMSLDGFIADRNDDVGPLFDWYRVGPVTTPSANERWRFDRLVEFTVIHAPKKRAFSWWSPSVRRRAEPAEPPPGNGASQRTTDGPGRRGPRHPSTAPDALRTR